MKSALKPLYKDQYDLGVMAKSAVIISWVFRKELLVFVLINLDISSMENSLETDQLASSEAS